MYRGMDIKYWIAFSMTLGVVACLLGSIITTAKPVGSQNKSVFGLLIATSVFASVAAWWLGYIVFKGNPTAQVTFLLFFTVILFMTTMTTATQSAHTLIHF